MSKLELTDDQIVDLIFEKKIIIDNICVDTKSSCLSILAKLEDRLRNGKIITCKTPVFCGSAEKRSGALRKQPYHGTYTGRKKGVCVEV